MSTQTATRIGAIGGLVYTLGFIPAYIVGTPEAATTGGVEAYFDEARDFVFAHESLIVISTFGFLWFLGVLYALLRRAEGNGGALSSVALVGGVTFIALSTAGIAAEALVPTTALRFGESAPGTDFASISLSFAISLYHFAQVGTAVLVAATSVLALQTGVVPKWLAWLGFAVALIALLHITFGVISGIVGLVWVALISLLMLTGSVGRQPAR